MDKRRRNTQASARFRANKKKREAELKSEKELLQDNCSKLASRVQGEKLEEVVLGDIGRGGEGGIRFVAFPHSYYSLLFIQI